MQSLTFVLFGFVLKGMLAKCLEVRGRRDEDEHFALPSTASAAWD
jgi:hypothetical protein